MPNKISNEIKFLIKELGISQKEASDIIAEALDEEKGFYERFKKALNRSNNEDKLKSYLNIIKSSEMYRKVFNLKSKLEGDEDILGYKMKKELNQLGKLIAQQITENESNI